jgi:SSS family solute:Na+ symporter
VLVVGTAVAAMPGGLAQVLSLAASEGKMSLGSFAPDPTTSTFWVVLLYGLFINLNNFGIDQSYVQRYHAASSDREAGRSVWLAAWLYLPISLLFFLIGTVLFAFYRVHPELLEPLTGTAGGVTADRVLPHFLVSELPPGVAGLVLAALLAAAMSSIDTSLNSSATVVLSDLYGVYVEPQPDERRSMAVLRLATLAVGAAGVGIALAMIGVASLLDAWWTLSGVFAGGLLGLFLLGFVSRRAKRPAAVLAVVSGVLVILWMTLSPRLGGELAFLRSPLHTNLVIVVGTLTIFVVGVCVSRWRGSGDDRGPYST